MPCSCRSTECECEDACHCCACICECEECLGIRRRLGTYYRPCIAFMNSYLCNPIPVVKRTIHGDYPNLDFLNVQADQPRNNEPDERANVERISSEAARRFSSALQPCAPESSPSSREQSSDDSLIFPMEIDLSPSASTETKSRDFQDNSASSSNRRVSYTPLDLRGLQSKIHRCCHNSEASGLKWIESSNCEMTIGTLQQQEDATSLKPRESQSETATTHAVGGCSYLNPVESISEIEESRESGVSSLSTVAVTDLNQIILLEKQLQTVSPGVPGSSHHNPNKTISKQEESLTDSASHIVSQSTDEYDKDFLPSNLLFDSSPSTYLFSKLPPSQLSASATDDLPQSVREMKSLEQSAFNSVGTQSSSATSLSKFETIKISDSHPIDKSDSGSSTETISNETNYVFHGPVSPSNSVVSSELNNSAIQCESSQPGTSETVLALIYPKYQNPEESKSARRGISPKPDQSADISQKQSNVSSEDESPAKKSPKKKIPDST